ncbi:hypothetical protein LTR62_001889 [Meristemomyces frigidus]|uniref:Uncharacterized protein n=1 Tax=Meristemomyces frigidus TaxID=1508187 RepID=A0AAN7T7N8_9PEZI|nr:hypothetical protein LTR62_001889 [Meristemomyces frigidus]
MAHSPAQQEGTGMDEYADQVLLGIGEALLEQCEFLSTKLELTKEKYAQEIEKLDKEHERVRSEIVALKIHIDDLEAGSKVEKDGLLKQDIALSSQTSSGMIASLGDCPVKAIGSAGGQEGPPIAGSQELAVRHGGSANLAAPPRLSGVHRLLS